jgi:hypothetical protein
MPFSLEEISLLLWCADDPAALTARPTLSGVWDFFLTILGE